MRRSLDMIPTDDPLTLAMAPPMGETPAQKQAREFQEAEARLISEEIDEQIRKERDAEKRKRRPVKLLLLGQSESGKTATLKNFQLTYARKEWLEERTAWRSVIFLNLVRNVNNILEQLAQEFMSSRPENSSEEDAEVSSPRKSMKTPLQFGEQHQLISLRLTPLRGVQADLERRIGAGTRELHATDVRTAAPFEGGTPHRRALQEFSINSRNGWKSALDKIRPHRRQDANTLTKGLTDDVNGAVEVIDSCREDMKALWADPTIKEMLNRRKTRRLEDAPGFFLADADRIASRKYQPSDDDIIRARLRTLGVQEYHLVFEHGRAAGQEWLLFDVGGTRSSRGAWYPYFEGVDAIIFLAPISCFNEKLAEDSKVNRLEDSYLLWRSVQSCKLLANTQMILFLNKCDLLQQKLQRGVRIRDSVPSFGDRKNDLPTVTRYFQQHFKDIQRQYSPTPRPFFVHLTSVIDTRSTAVTLGAVEESILRNHLRHADLM